MRAAVGRKRAVTTEAPRYAVRAPDVTIEEAVSPAARDVFVRFQLDHYKGDPFFIAPIVAERRDFLDPKRNPFFEHAHVSYLLARRGGKLVGRIAVVHDARYNAYHRANTGTFGMFECVNDAGVAASLFDAALIWLRSRGIKQVMGPLNLAFHHECGLLVDGFDKPPSMSMPYNPRYYGPLIEACGFSKLKDLFSFELHSSQGLPEKVARLAERTRASGAVSIRRIDTRDPMGEFRRIKSVFDSMLTPQFGFVPLSEAELEDLVNRFRALIVLRSDMCLIAEVQGEPVAFCLTVPDAYLALKEAHGFLSTFGLPIGLAKVLWATRKLDRLRVLIFGIRPGFRRRGIDALLTQETVQRAKALGYHSAEMGWVSEDDRLVIRAVQATGAKRIKTYRLYQRAVD